MKKSLLMAGLLVSTLAQADMTDSIKEEFKVPRGGSLLVDVVEGSIQVQSWNKKQVRVEIERSVNASSEKGAQKILENYDFRIREDRGVVTVSVRQKTRRFFSFGNDLDLEVVVFVPKEFNLDLDTAGGMIMVDDLKGEVICDTSGGKIRIGAIDGDVEASTSGGNIRLESCDGNAKVETSGGTIRVGNVSGDLWADTSGGNIMIERAEGKVYAHTSGGSISLRDAQAAVDLETSAGSITASFSKQPKNACRMISSAGKVELNLARRMGFDLDLETSAGRIVTDFPLTIDGDYMSHSAHGKINGGGPKLVMRTSAGNIELNKL